ncbi:Phosphoribosylformylglycinamidine synthase, PurS subunit [Liberibacter crescens BT-1]|uniref:Phosphoribosylformylglycinamidine synthase subunit PurS n=1 Tax=Liberibacter crescens (strain BT-1) TaxID=1215343 RepID=L0EVY5_LIBCB|nr:phosphoribosylformylglycinamidine synthase subunit PurS [Liberibacter crescens]AGA64526.1 Phosphoribosylformylglycinamidine synthase, PurS subunit [Liberibacter crescens BT-1]AMC12677.1 phosphoribosylformylglycinamidine synthase [Liberibacter crescens]
MNLFKARVIVTIKDSILDPQGKAIEGAIANTGFKGIRKIRQGKVFDIELFCDNQSSAEQELKNMCEKLLANTVIENYDITIDLP